jgi:peptidoglycan/xylan/chitin deacetylase (PgdA/CDA1 family)
MIHEIRESIFDLPLENYILTFDDGLYSQYYYYPRFQDIPTEKIYFISSNILCTGSQSSSFPACEEAHEKAFNGNCEDYMTLEQVKKLSKEPLVSIGGHGHNHICFGHFSKTTEKMQLIATDTQEMLHWFYTNLGTRPTRFCFPYNDDVNGLYPGILKKFGFTEFYGKERIDVSSLS